MKTAIATLTSASPYSQSAPINIPKKEKESADSYEKRCWRDRVHVAADGKTLVIPPMAPKNALSECAQYLSETIPGKGKATWTKHFLAGVMVIDPIVLVDPRTGKPIQKDEVEGEWLYLDATGKKNSGTRVWRCYPIVREWRGEATFHVLDDTITETIFERHLRQAGQFIGVGRFRPRNGGFYGRFHVEAVNWKHEDAADAA